MTHHAGVRRSGWLALLLCVGGLVASCGNDDDASTDDPTVDSASLELAGQTFESTEVHGHTLVPDTVISLSFEDGRVVANAGCNTMTGEAS